MKKINKTTEEPKNPSPDNKDLFCEEKDHRAVVFLKKALKIAEQKEGPNHPSVATALNNLAMLYKYCGLTEVAEPLFKRALAIKEKALGKDHPEVAIILSNLGLMYDTFSGPGNKAKAEQLFKLALKIQEKALGPDHLDVAETLSRLAYPHEYRGKKPNAEPLLKRALAIRENALGPDHPDVATTLEDLARLYATQKKQYAKAEKLYVRALEIRKAGLRPISRNLDELTEVYRNQVQFRNYGKYARAKQLEKYSHAIGNIISDKPSKIEKIKK